ncbi:prepilin-type N-terminal cleavage/methylation domain-containing protein [Sulfurimonas autotrophica]|uniref:N-terminal methylation motif domain protein n=1 Tax=Sulfurimonas autotrophica (strain ATCC BAA-671 / DSM 16294 / JCM 11897 / OK10) TaxID=563040 RepID=E0UUZ0_SULAO|nr:prepilin-type N-terminal cleavage/methylation domain-containing protein [Sulfurimonas autotrophica]ADN08502.1 N-terminal methylation motif domain protein [Sulfurimonas autotrophica DSM 16294]
MKKQAFSLLELIFVIIIIGILSGVAISSFKPHHLRDDTNFVLMKLEETRYKAIGYNKSLPSSDINYSIGCISVDTLSKTDTQAYKFYSYFDLSSSSAINVICFDALGRVHDGDIDNNQTTLDSLQNNEIHLTYTYQNKISVLKIDSLSGNIHRVN